MNDAAIATWVGEIRAWLRTTHQAPFASRSSAAIGCASASRPEPLYQRDPTGSMRTRDAALIRKLCSLGLPPQTLAQSLLPALRQIIPAHSGGVFWVDADFQMTGLYAERLLSPEAMAAYHENHYDDGATGFVNAFRRRAESPQPVSSHSFDGSEQATVYFKSVLQPLEAYHVLYGVLRNNAQPFAQISLYRGRNDPPFDKRDEASLDDIVDYLARGLYERASTQAEDDAPNIVEESLGIVSRRGDVVACSSDWQRLLRLAVLKRLAPRLARAEADDVGDFLRSVGGATTNLSISLSSPHGRFLIRVFPLEAPSPPALRELGVLIRREESRAVALLRGAGNSSLSAQQREVALLLACGKTNPEIAEALGLALNTVGFHVKEVYARLEVNERAAVSARLLGLAMRNA